MNICEIAVANIQNYCVVITAAKKKLQKLLNAIIATYS